MFLEWFREVSKKSDLKTWSMEIFKRHGWHKFLKHH
jgi:hypothetical protein